MWTHNTPLSLWSLLCLLPVFISAISIDCSSVVVDKKHFNLEPLKGPHSLYKVVKRPPTIQNTTFTFDVCRPLRKTKGVSKEEDCPNGSRVCAITRHTDTVGGKPIIDAPIPIAGEFLHSEGGSLDPKWTRLKAPAPKADRQTEGLRLEMHGGRYEKENQKAIIEFHCPRSAADKLRKRDELQASEEDDADDDVDKEDPEDESDGVTNDGQGGTIKYVKWKIEDGTKVLRLDWQTEYACEDSEGSEEKSSSAHWGFFTWFIIIVFLAIAAYLIFGSWLNYNRLGTRGFDSVPHADTLRDLPYLFRDWMRRVVDTVQGGHSRAGYSAV